jgi:hypothetical protein
MQLTERSTRRQLLVGIGGVTIVPLAGCSGLLDDTDADADEDEHGDTDENGNEAETDTSEDDEEAENEEESNDQLEFTTYASADYGYEFEYPNAWDVDETYPQQIWIHGEDNAEVISSVFQYPPEITLDEIATEAIANTRNSYSEFDERDQNDIQIDSGEDGRVIEWIYHEANHLYHAKYLLVVIEGVVFSLEIRTSEDAYDERFAALADEIHTSFTIVEPPEEPTLAVDELETYDNAEYGYSIDYPAVWTVYDDRPEDVLISDDVGLSEMAIWLEPAGGATLDEFVEALRSDAETDPEVDLLDDESTTLDSGQDAHILEARLIERTLEIRGTYLIAVADNLFYAVFIGVIESLYDDDFAAVVDAIIESFSIENGSTQAQLSLPASLSDATAGQLLYTPALFRPVTTTATDPENSDRRGRLFAGGAPFGR